MVNDCEVVRLGCNIGESTSSRIVQALPGISEDPQVLGHRRVLVRGSRESIREASGGKPDCNFGFHVISAAD